MPWWGILTVLLSAYLLYAVLLVAAKNKRPLQRALLSMLSGVLTLFAINLTAGFTGVRLPVSLLSLLVSSVGGVPGVTLLLFLNLLI